MSVHHQKICFTKFVKMILKKASVMYCLRELFQKENFKGIEEA